MIGSTFSGEHGLGLAAIIGLLVALGLVLAFRIAQRGNPKPRRTRIGVFIERDRFPEDGGNEDDEAITRTWPPPE